MNENDKHGRQAAFYERCAEALGVPHHYRPWVGRPPNRWNNRHPGNGRFPGRGCVRWFGPQCIHVMLEAPNSVSRYARSEDEAIAIIQARFEAQAPPAT